MRSQGVLTVEIVCIKFLMIFLQATVISNVCPEVRYPSSYAYCVVPVRKATLVSD